LLSELVQSAQAFAVLTLALLVAGCGSETEKRPAAPTTAPTTTAATTAPATTATQATTGAATTTAPPSSSTVTYEQQMQARTALFTPQCFASDPTKGQRERMAYFDRAADDLEAIDPPADVAREHRQLIEATRGYEANVRRLLPRYDRLARLIKDAQADGVVDSKEAAPIREENQELFTESLPPRRLSDKESAALRAIKRKGYDVQQKGPPKPEYERRVQALVDQAGKPSLSFRATTSAAGLRSQLQRQSEIANRAARALGGITPPLNALNGQVKLSGALCQRAQRYHDYTVTLKHMNDARTVNGILQDARDIDRILGVYEAAFSDFRAAGYRLHPARVPAR
jgi:hypothetical protein